MNHNKNVVVFTLVFTIILLGYSVLVSIYPSYSAGLSNLSIIADVVKTKGADTTSIITLATGKKDSAAVQMTPSGPRDLNKYLQGKTITAFYTDNTVAALPQLMRKLTALKQGKKGKVRIAWLGDSFIEGDQVTKTFRRQMQETFGGTGAGFVPVTSVTTDGFRSTVSQHWSEDWKEENFKTKDPSAPLFLSGRVYHAANSTFNLRDYTPGKDSSQKLEKSLICGQTAANTTITVNGQQRQIAAPSKLNRIILDKSASHKIDIALQNDQLPIYGVSMEGENGVVVDNFSFRGISGEELGKLDTGFLKAIQEQNTYDLVILEYGVNVLYRPDNTDFNWHKRNMQRVLQRLHAAMPNTDFLVISTSDRAFRYPDGNRTAVGLDNLVKTQAELAYDNGMAFYNMYASMGGAGTIVRWADSTPVMAGHDYVHPNGRGAELLGNLFFDAFMKDYNKATQAIQPGDTAAVKINPAPSAREIHATEVKKKDTTAPKKEPLPEDKTTDAAPVKDTGTH